MKTCRHGPKEGKGSEIKTKMAQKETHDTQMGKQGRKLSIIGLYSSYGLYTLYKTQQ